MKKISFILVLVLFLSVGLLAQTREWQWGAAGAQPNSSGSYAWAHGMTTDPAGNAISTGYFFGASISFGSYMLQDTETGFSAIYVVKYDPSGNVLWAQMAKGPGNNYSLATCTDRSGNVYIAGYFSSDSLIFGSTAIYKYPGDTTNDIFIAKYSSSGNLLWTRAFGGDYDDRIFGLATDAAGNVYAAGTMESDSISIGAVQIINPHGKLDHMSLLIKLDSNANSIWAVNSASTGGVEAYCVATDPVGNIAIAGRFAAGFVSFGSQNLLNTRGGYNDIFITKYDSSGNAIWAQDAGGTLDDEAFGIATDAANNIYVTGFINSDTANFGTSFIINNAVASSDAYIAKYDPTGTFLWVHGVGGIKNEVGNAIAIDSNGNAYITGYYFSAQFVSGSDTIYNADITGSSDDIFVVGFDAAGNTLNAISAGGLSYEVGSGIAADHSGNLYLTGLFRSDDIVFGPSTLDNCTSVNNFNPFAAKYISTPTGIQNAGPAKYLSLYPNPAENILIAESSSFAFSEVSALIYDVTGRIIETEQSANGDKMFFNIAHLSSGMYCIKITLSAGQILCTKFVKK